MEYYVIIFEKPKKDANKFVYVPKSWVIADKQKHIVFKYPKDEVTKCIEEGKEPSEEWPVHFETLLATHESLDVARSLAENMQKLYLETLTTRRPPVSSDRSTTSEQPSQDPSTSEEIRAIAGCSANQDIDNSILANNTLDFNETQMTCEGNNAVRDLTRQIESLQKRMGDIEHIRHVPLSNAETLKQTRAETPMAVNDCVHSNTTGEQDVQTQNNTAESLTTPRRSVNVQENQAQREDGVSPSNMNIRPSSPSAESTSQWTLRHPKKAPGLQELTYRSGVYVNSKTFADYKIKANMVAKGSQLAKLLLKAIFSDEALLKCSLTGARPVRCKNPDELIVKPGLDKRAISVLVDFVTKYSRKMKWDEGTDPNKVKRSLSKYLDRLKKKPQLLNH